MNNSCKSYCSSKIDIICVKMIAQAFAQPAQKVLFSTILLYWFRSFVSSSNRIQPIWIDDTGDYRTSILVSYLFLFIWILFETIFWFLEEEKNNQIEFHGSLFAFHHPTQFVFCHFQFSPDWRHFRDTCLACPNCILVACSTILFQFIDVSFNLKSDRDVNKSAAGQTDAACERSIC